MHPIVWLIYEVLSIFSILIFAWVIISVLISFNVVNRHHPIVGKVFEILEQIINPVLNPIRRFMPNINGIDLSPIVLILGVSFLQKMLLYYSTPTIIMH